MGTLNENPVSRGTLKVEQLQEDTRVGKPAPIGKKEVGQ